MKTVPPASRPGRSAPSTAAAARPTAANAKPEAKVAGKPADKPAEKIVDYRVRPGDTLSSIAKAHKTDVDALAKLNPQIVVRDEIHAGSLVRVPAPPEGGQAPSAAVSTTPAPSPAPAREPVPAAVQQGARRSAAARDAAARDSVTRAAPSRPEPPASRRTTLASASRTAGGRRTIGGATSTAAVDRAADQLGRVEGQNKPWSAQGSVGRHGARFKGEFAKELNTPVEVARVDDQLVRARVTRAAGTFRESGSIEAAAGLREGLKASVGYNQQLIGWGYKVVSRSPNLPLGFSAEGRSKVAAGTFIDAGASTELKVDGQGPTAYARVQASGFGGARNLSEGSITSPHGILKVSGTVSVEGGGGAALGAEAGLRDGKVVLGANVGAKIGWGLEAGGRIELDYLKLFEVVREAGTHGLQELQQRLQGQQPERAAVQGWFR